MSENITGGLWTEGEEAFQRSKAQELIDYRNERENNEEELKARKESLANAIKETLGNDIKETLEIAKKEAEEEAKKPKKKRANNFIKKLFRVCR
jgi:hypothetical protein